MKITLESKFNVGQTVWVVFGGKIVESKILSAKIGRYADIYYDCGGSYYSGRVVYLKYEFAEYSLYGTRQEAVVALKLEKNQAIKIKIYDLKKTICGIARTWSQSDVDTEELKAFIKLCDCWNKQLLQLINNMKKK